MKTSHQGAHPFGRLTEENHRRWPTLNGPSFLVMKIQNLHTNFFEFEKKMKSLLNLIKVYRHLPL